MSKTKIVPVIMSGGAGSRLWPLSRQASPKQLLPLVTDKTMAQETVARFSGSQFTDPVFICNALHASAIKSQMREISRDVDAIITEPVGRNTAPCAVVAAVHAAQNHKGALVLLAPADHHVTKPEAFRDAIDAAVPAALAGHLVTFGITPTHAETGYGYIEKGKALHPGVFDVSAFKEKPDADTAASYIADGNYAWNAGIFLFSPDAFLAEIEKFNPDIRARAAQAYQMAATQDGVTDLDKTAFSACPSQSIDYAVMETTDKAAIVPCDIGWNDIGSFASLYDVRQSTTGATHKGDILTVNAENNLVQTDGPLVTLVGVSGLAVIVHEGQILVADMDAAQDVKAIVEQLKSNGRSDNL